jgi:hypothetical protein
VSEELKDKLSRWSLRKLAARRGIAADDEAESAAHEATPTPAITPDSEETVAFRGEGAGGDAVHASDEAPPNLPSIDELTADSDYTVFFGKNVPETLKNAALRKLWRSDPVFNQIDGLDNYAEDFNVIDKPITLAETGYKIGKGFLDDGEEKFAVSEPTQSESIERSRESAASRPDECETGGTLSQNVAATDQPAPVLPRVEPDGPSEPAGGQATYKAD